MEKNLVFCCFLSFLKLQLKNELIQKKSEYWWVEATILIKTLPCCSLMS